MTELDRTALVVVDVQRAFDDARYLGVNAFKPEITGEPDLLVTKRVTSAFHGDPDLAAWLRAREVGGIAVCGITTNHCCYGEFATVVSTADLTG
jgi:nicotinamidase-related amidase